MASDATVTPHPLSAGELTSIAAQLAAAGPAADEFADLAARATRVPGVLEEAFVALVDGDVERVADLTAGARADHDAVVAWETDHPTLPVWIETTDAMIGAVERISRCNPGRRCRRGARCCRRIFRAF